MSNYQEEQLESLRLVRRFLSKQTDKKIDSIKRMTDAYLSFRNEVHAFLYEHFHQVCTEKCYQSRLSACCSKEGIITFFADVVINALFSTQKQLDAIESVLKKDNDSFKCIFLSASGCLWRIKPIVCEMFLCDFAQKSVFDDNSKIRGLWEALKRREMDFKWPDKPVLFDEIEKLFLNTGLKSSLMYFHFSPGLLRVKKQSMTLL